MLGDSVRRRQPNGGRTPKRTRLSKVKWRVIVPATIGALLIPFAVGYALAVFVLFPKPKTDSAGGIVVPNLVGKNANEAQRMISAAGLGRIEPMELPHPDAAAGEVTAQDPLPGQQLRAGAEVRVSVSSGPARLAVPDVQGFTPEAAQQILTRMGFVTRRLDEASAAAYGKVFRVDPVPGTPMKLPATVTIVISTGLPPLDSVIVPPDTGGVPPDTRGVSPDTGGVSPDTRGVSRPGAR
jgi:eukaryotic-like serine/threonine-protein kinase